MNKQSDYSAVVIALSIVCIGMLLIILGQVPMHWGTIDLSKILVGAGSTITFIGALDWLYEVYTKKKMFVELTELILGSKSLSDSGIAEFFIDSRDIKFKPIIDESSQIATIFSYNSRFLEDYETQLAGLLKRGGVAEFVFLGRNSATINLMKVLGWDETSMVSHYAKMDRFQERLNGLGHVARIVFVDAIPRYSVVKLDRTIFVIWNTGSHVRQPVPAFRISYGSPLWNFIAADIENVKAEGRLDR